MNEEWNNRGLVDGMVGEGTVRLDRRNGEAFSSAVATNHPRFMYRPVYGGESSLFDCSVASY